MSQRGPDVLKRIKWGSLGIPTLVDGKANPIYYQKYYSLRKEEILQKNREWRKQNPGYHRMTTMRYRAIAVSLIIQRDGLRCAICGEQVVQELAAIDHIQQRAFGGQDTADNVRLLHRECNLRRARTKGDDNGKTVDSIGD